MASCNPAPTLFTGQLSELKPVLLNALPDIADAGFQQIVGEMLYLAYTTCPDITYHAMALSQYSAKPTWALMLAAKCVLHYLISTRDYTLCFGGPHDDESPLAGYMQCISCSDADWVSTTNDQKSVSSYCFFYLGCLISWAMIKQKSLQHPPLSPSTML